jgi:phosphonate transport system substrate-binding protein
LDRSEHTSLKIVLRQQLLGTSFTVTPNAIVVERPEDTVTSLSLMKNSIAYMSLGDAILEGINANILAVEGVEPSLNNFTKGLYSYTRPFGLTIGQKPRKTTMKFIRFVYSEEGRQIMSNHGFSPITMDLTVAVLPEQDLLAQEQRYAPLVDYLSQRLGLQTTVKLKLLPNYGEVIKEFQEGGVNAAFLGSLAFALARAQAGIEPLVRPEKDGVSQYRGLIVTRKDSGIENLADLKGKSFGMVDKATTAGYIFPIIYFREHGIEEPERYLDSIAYTGSHDLLFIKVFNRELDAGGAKDLMLWEVAKTRPSISEELRVLAVSPPVPNNTFVLSGKLDFPCFHCHKMVPTTPKSVDVPIPREPEELKQLLSNLLMKLHETPEGEKVLEALGADRFVKTTLDDLKEVNKMIYQAGFDPKNYNP